jgi:putative phosphoribosyl transferase
MSAAVNGVDREAPVLIPVGKIVLDGDLGLPANPFGIVVFAHGSGSSRRSPRNRYVAEVLRHAGFGTLLFDLLTAREEREEQSTGHLRFDIGLLADRLACATDWLNQQTETRALPLAYFGASTGAGAALVAAAKRPERIAAVISRGGRPDLAGATLMRVLAPTLLIVGGHDAPVIQLNKQALKQLASPHKQLVIVPGATHLFEEPGTLEEVAALAVEWLARYLGRSISTE